MFFAQASAIRLSFSGTPGIQLVVGPGPLFAKRAKLTAELALVSQHLADRHVVIGAAAGEGDLTFRGEKHAGRVEGGIVRPTHGSPVVCLVGLRTASGELFRYLEEVTPGEGHVDSIVTSTRSPACARLSTHQSSANRSSRSIISSGRSVTPSG
jgi:hypothetical protein